MRSLAGGSVRALLLLLAIVLPLRPARSAENMPDRAAAERDLAKGTVVYWTASGAAGPGQWSPAVDATYGLPVQDMGCINSKGINEYNSTVAAWIASHGLPKSSLKARFVTEAAARAAIARGKTVKPDRTVKLEGGVLAHLGPQGLELLRAGTAAPVVTVWSVKEPAVVARSGNDAVFVDLGPGRPLLHVDLGARLILQRFAAR